MVVPTVVVGSFHQAAAASRAKRQQRRAQRATSNIFAMFTPDQISEFKEVTRF